MLGGVQHFSRIALMPPGPHDKHRRLHGCSATALSSMSHRASRAMGSAARPRPARSVRGDCELPRHRHALRCPLSLFKSRRVQQEREREGLHPHTDGAAAHQARACFTSMCNQRDYMAELTELIISLLSMVIRCVLVQHL